MKKLTAYMTAMLFVLALATVASAASLNGITDFNGASYDRGDIGLALEPAAGMNSAEGVSAGGLRDEDKELYNGTTDFTGKSWDTGDMGLISGNSMEGQSAGGLRDEDVVVHNGVTDFSGKAYDRGDIGF